MSITTVYTGEDLPKEYRRTIFLAGPTPRSEDVKSWRPAAIKALQSVGYDGVVLVPEFRDKVVPSYDGVVEWETKMLQESEIILFWVPRDLETMPAFTTNVEFGLWLSSGKMVYGRPDSAIKNRYLDFHYKRVYQCDPETTLEKTVLKAVDKFSQGMSERK